MEHRLGVVRHVGWPGAAGCLRSTPAPDGAAEQLAAVHRSGAPSRDATERRTAQRSDRQLVRGTSRVEPSRRGRLQWPQRGRGHRAAGGHDDLVLRLDSTWAWDRRLLESVPDSFRKPARNERNLRASDFVLRGVLSAEILDYLQVKSRRDIASSAVCHAEGRGFESLQPLLKKPRKSRGFLLPERRGQVVIRPALPVGATKSSEADRPRRSRRRSEQSRPLPLLARCDSEAPVRSCARRRARSGC